MIGELNIMCELKVTKEQMPKDNCVMKYNRSVQLAKYILCNV